MSKNVLKMSKNCSKIVQNRCKSKFWTIWGHFLPTVAEINSVHTLVSALVGVFVGALVGALVGTLVGALVGTLVGSNFAVRVLRACLMVFSVSKFRSASVKRHLSTRHLSVLDLLLKFIFDGGCTCEEKMRSH